MRRSNLATVFYLAVVFLSGAVVGGFAVRLYLAKTVNAVYAPHSRADIRKQYVHDMRSRLQLTDGQVVQLEKIMDATAQRVHAMHKMIGDEHVRQVNAILNDTQKAEYAKMIQERRNRRQAHAH